MTYHSQQPPFCIKVELTEGCNLRCWFCGISGITERTGDYKFMSLGLARQIARAVREEGWTPRFEFTMRGEPTMNPNWIEVLRLFRQFNPRSQLMVTSNGGGILRQPGVTANIDAAFDAGLNLLCLDDYVGVSIVDKIRARYEGSAEQHEYPAERDWSPHHRRPLSTRAIIYIAPIDYTEVGSHSHLNCQGGAAAPKDYSWAGKRCALPFRDLVIRRDGKVVLCCNDWRGEFKLGDAVSGLGAIWHGAAMDGARRRLYQGRRDFGPCHGCNEKSHRVGLLPNHDGQDEMPAPTPESDAAIERALAGPSYTLPVLREWEVAATGQEVT